jgi:hypothetical protein
MLIVEVEVDGCGVREDEVILRMRMRRNVQVDVRGSRGWLDVHDVVDDVGWRHIQSLILVGMRGFCAKAVMVVG